MMTELTVAPLEFTVHRFEAGHLIPDRAGGQFLAIIRTRNELCVVCESGIALASPRRESGWRLIAFDGTHPFTDTGVLASVLNPLAEAKVSILAFSSFDTDYLFVKGHSLAEAVQALSDAGHRVTFESNRGDHRS